VSDIDTDDLLHYLYDLRNGSVVVCSLAKIIEAKRKQKPIIAQQVIDGVKDILNNDGRFEIGEYPRIAGAGSCYQALRELLCDTNRQQVKLKTKMITSKKAKKSLVSNGLVFEPTPAGEALLVELVNEMERILKEVKRRAGLINDA